LNAPDISNPMADIIAPADYIVEVRTPNGCVAKDTVSLSTAVTDFIPAICMVTANENNQNRIVWQSEPNTSLDSILIFRESSLQTGEYDLIGTIPSSASGIYIDTATIAFLKESTYKIEVKDICGFTTEMSDLHKPLHLIVNKGTANNWNLLWNNYVGIPVSDYKIYRGTSKNNLSLIAASTGNNNTYMDDSVPSGNNYYQIEMELSENCSELKLVSNIVNIFNGNMAIYPESITEAFIYPNPAFDKLIIENVQSADAILEIYNLQGKLVLNQLVGSGRLDISGLPKGIYTVRLIDSGLVLINKLIKE
jgi:hypothetical protein